jgi:YidC/Oxa1 family membrane protein insertase
MFHEFFYRPLFNLLVGLYNTVSFEDFGVAIILLTIIIRIVLYPLFYKSFRNQALMTRIQPHVKRIQEEHKKDRAKQAEALMALYREHKLNPFSGFFLILIQLPVLIALYQVFLKGFGPGVFSDLYSFVAEPEHLNSTLFGLISLGKPNMIVVALAVVAQYFQGKASLRPQAKNSEKKQENPQAEFAARMGKQMVFIGPLLTLLILPSLPAAVGLYWFVTSVFSILQQRIINRKLDAVPPTSIPWNSFRKK